MRESPTVRSVVFTARAKTLRVVAALVLLTSCGKHDQPRVAPADESSNSNENQMVAKVTDYREMLAGFQNELELKIDAGADEDTLGIAQLEANVGMCMDALGRTDEAIAALERAAARFSALDDNIEGKMDGLGAVTDALGVACHAAGRYEEAERHFREAIHARQSAGNGLAATSEAHLGNLFVTMARFPEARSLLHGALDAATNQETHLLRLTYLGRFYHTIGSYDEALLRYSEAEQSARRLWGSESSQVAAIIGNKGVALLRAGQLAGAREAFLSALSISEAIGNASDIADAMNNMANVAFEQGQLDEAADYLNKCVKIRMAGGDADDPAVLTNLSTLGHIAHIRGDDGDSGTALFWLEEAKSRALTLLGAKHPLTIGVLQDLAYAQIDADRAGEARALARQAHTAGKALLADVLNMGTEQQKVDYRRKVDLLSLFCALGETDAIANVVAQTKGAVLAAVIEGRAGLKGAATALSATPGKIAGRLAADSAVVEYVRYSHYQSPAQWSARYGAVIFSANAGPLWCPLPDSDEQRIEGLLRALGDHVRHEEAADAGRDSARPLRKLDAVLRRLHDALWLPVRDALPPGARHVGICPDGALSSVPFAVLLGQNADGGSRMLCEDDLTLSFLTSCRDVVPGPPTRQWVLDDVLVCAVKKFRTRGNDHTLASARFSPDVLNALSKMRDLPGTGHELATISDVLAKAGVPVRGMKDGAGEAGFVEQARAPSILHLASHAFALPPAELPDGDDGWRAARSARLPMYRSGIVLGALDLENAGTGPSVDNVLFAEEAGRLDLRNTWLVTLSACNTGVGEQVAGEGVLGLQRGFFTAGAENIAMSLWPISDAYAPEFMGAFYQEILDSGDPAGALWRTQRACLQKLRATEGLGRAVWLAGPWVISSRRFPASRRRPSL